MNEWLPTGTAGWEIIFTAKRSTQFSVTSRMKYGTMNEWLPTGTAGREIIFTAKRSRGLERGCFIDGRICRISYWRCRILGRETWCNKWVTPDELLSERKSSPPKMPEMSWARILVDRRRRADIEREYKYVKWRNEWVTPPDELLSVR